MLYYIPNIGYRNMPLNCSAQEWIEACYNIENTRCKGEIKFNQKFALFANERQLNIPNANSHTWRHNPNMKNPIR